MRVTSLVLATVFVCPVLDQYNVCMQVVSEFVSWSPIVLIHKSLFTCCEQSQLIGVQL